jgi:glycosyltransferase involved in cell wall biosynthesis
MVAVSASVMARRLQAEGKTFRLSLLRRCWRSCAGIVCLAGSQSETFTVAGVLPQKIVTIPLGIDVNSLGSIGLRGKGDDPGDYVLSIGKDLGRDYPFLLQVAAMVPYPLRVVTSEQSLPRTAALPQNVSVEYDLSYAEVGERLAQCRFVVVPLVSDSTVGSDCTGQTVVLQALAAGRAVCVSHMPWLSDYLGAGEYALLPSRDPAAAAQTLVEIWENPTRCSQLAAAGQRAAREKFSLEAFVGSLARYLVQQVASRGNEQPPRQRSDQGAVRVIPRRFSDHRVFSDHDLSDIESHAEREHAVIVTTEKDFVKLRETRWANDRFAPSHVYVLRQETTVDDTLGPLIHQALHEKN